jgi:hypothetical protein
MNVETEMEKYKVDIAAIQELRLGGGRDVG